MNVTIKGGTEVILCGEDITYTPSALDNDGLLWNVQIKKKLLASHEKQCAGD